ncbi:MAG: CRISPR-associated endonuclease Cas2 [Thermoplasmata archaeon]|nr:CRISPR-associated endonuclease Cas2 [Thermoplasmata archaeon]
MHVIVVYDVAEERVSKVNKFLRCYLHWIQNSVFRGDITESNLQRMIDGLKEIIDLNYDSVTIYVLPSEKYLKKINLGIVKGTTDMIF